MRMALGSTASAGACGTASATHSMQPAAALRCPRRGLQTPAQHACYAASAWRQPTQHDKWQQGSGAHARVGAFGLLYSRPTPPTCASPAGRAGG